jgi:hypothetical protein
MRDSIRDGVICCVEAAMESSSRPFLLFTCLALTALGACGTNTPLSPAGGGGAGGANTDGGPADSGITLGVGGNGAGGRGATGPLTTTTFAAAYCDLLAPCCAMSKLATDGRQCRALIAGLAAPAAFDGAAAEACLSESRAALATPAGCQGLLVEMTTSCDRVFQPNTGTKKPGEACDDDDDCAPAPQGQVKCKAVNLGQEGDQCQVLLRGAEGSKPCVGDVEGAVTTYFSGGGTTTAYLCHAADGLRCDPTLLACARGKAVGEACSFGDDCVKTATCDDATNKCVPRKALGAACTGSGGFANDECVEGAYCQASGTCAAQRPNGAACNDDDECLGGDCRNGECRNGLLDFALGFLCGQP